VREFVVYSRQGCHLCEELLESLERLCRGRATVVVHDVDSNPEWADAYGIYVPVLFVDGIEVSRYQLDREAVVTLLAAG
jgi:glutaredoxin